MSNASAVAREVRWRVTGTSAWSPILSTPATGEINLPNLSPTVSYDVQVRNVAANGMRSDWTSYTISAPNNTQRIS